MFLFGSKYYKLVKLSGMKTDFGKKVWKVRRAVARATFMQDAPKFPTSEG